MRTADDTGVAGVSADDEMQKQECKGQADREM